MKVYFAGSIRGGRKDKEKYFELIEFLAEQAEVLTEHVGSKSLGSEGEKQLRTILFTKETWTGYAPRTPWSPKFPTPSLGVGYEIGVAEKTGKPILCLFDENQNEFRLSAMLSGNPNLQVISYRTIGEAKKANHRGSYQLLPQI